MQTKIFHKKFFHGIYFPMKRKQGLAPQKTSADYSADASYILILRTKLDSHFLQIL